jgi:hypothetical protein
VSAGALPWRQLLVLGCVVLGTHLLFLSAMGAGTRAVRGLPASFATRTIVPPPPAAVEAPETPGALPQRAPARPPLRAAKAKRSGPAPSPRDAERHVPPAPMLAYALPPSVQLRFKVIANARGEPREGEGELDWRHDGERYEAMLRTGGGALPPRALRSVGRVTPQGLAPQRFSTISRTEEAAHFQRNQGKVTFSSNRPDADLLAGAQDRLSVMLHLGALIAGAPGNFRSGTTVVVQTAGTREALPWVFLVEGEEELVLPGGTLRGLKLTRAPVREYDQKVEVWLCPAMDYVPVRLRLTQPNGDSVDHQWSSTDRG